MVDKYDTCFTHIICFNSLGDLCKITYSVHKATLSPLYKLTMHLRAWWDFLLCEIGKSLESSSEVGLHYITASTQRGYVVQHIWGRFIWYIGIDGIAIFFYYDIYFELNCVFQTIWIMWISTWFAVGNMGKSNATDTLSIVSSELQRKHRSSCLSRSALSCENKSNTMV